MKSGGRSFLQNIASRKYSILYEECRCVQPSSQIAEPRCTGQVIHLPPAWSFPSAYSHPTHSSPSTSYRIPIYHPSLSLNDWQVGVILFRFIFLTSFLSSPYSSHPTSNFSLTSPSLNFLTDSLSLAYVVFCLTFQYLLV